MPNRIEAVFGVTNPVALVTGRAMLPEMLDEATRQAAVVGTLLQRAGAAPHVTDAVVLLAAHEFITGVCLPVDGGRLLSREDSSSRSSAL